MKKKSINYVINCKKIILTKNKRYLKMRLNNRHCTRKTSTKHLLNKTVIVKNEQIDKLHYYW